MIERASNREGFDAAGSVLGEAVGRENAGEASGNVLFVAKIAELRELAFLRNGPRWWEQDKVALSDDISRAQAACKEKAKPLTATRTADQVRSMSRWAKQQMEGYSTVPALADTALQPIGIDETHGNLVLEGAIDTLPIHHSLVTR